MNNTDNKGVVYVPVTSDNKQTGKMVPAAPNANLSAQQNYTVLILTAAIKFLLILSTVTVICLIGVAYAEWWNIVLSYMFCALTLMYCIVSVAVHILMMQRSPEQLSSLAVGEAITLSIMLIGWLLICATSADIALQTNENTGNAFGWASGVAGINIVLCIVLMVIYCGQIFLLHEPLEPKTVQMTHVPQTQPGPRAQQYQY